MTPEQMADFLSQDPEKIEKIVKLQGFFRHRLGLYQLILLTLDVYEQLVSNPQGCAYGKVYLSQIDNTLRYSVKDMHGLHEGILIAEDISSIDLTTIVNQDVLDAQKDKILAVTEKRHHTHGQSWRLMQANKSVRRDGTSFYPESTQTLIQSTLFYRRSLNLPKIKALIEAVYEGDWSAAIFQDDNVVAYALSAISTTPSQISMTQYQTIVLYHALVRPCRNQLDSSSQGVSVLKLLNEDGSWSVEAETLLLPAMAQITSNNQEPPMVLTEVEKEHFRIILGQMATSEQIFFSCPMFNDTYLQISALFSNEATKWMYILSYGAMDALMIAKYSEAQSVDLVFSTQAPTVRQLAQLKKQSKMSALSFPGEVITPYAGAKVHETIVSDITACLAMLHDVVHRHFMSRVLSPVRQAIFDMAEVISKETGIDMSLELWHIYDFIPENVNGQNALQQFHEFLDYIEFNKSLIFKALIILFLCFNAKHYSFINSNYLEDENLRKKLPEDLQQMLGIIIKHEWLLKAYLEDNNTALFVTQLASMKALNSLGLPISHESYMRYYFGTEFTNFVFHKITRSDITLNKYGNYQLNSIVVRDNITKKIYYFYNLTVFMPFNLYNISRPFSGECVKKCIKEFDLIEYKSASKFFLDDDNKMLSIKKEKDFIDYLINKMSQNYYCDYYRNNYLHYAVLYGRNVINFILEAAKTHHIYVMNPILSTFFRRNNNDQSSIDLMIALGAKKWIYDIIEITCKGERLFKDLYQSIVALLPYFIQEKDEPMVKFLLLFADPRNNELMDKAQSAAQGDDIMLKLLQNAIAPTVASYADSSEPSTSTSRGHCP